MRSRFSIIILTLSFLSLFTAPLGITAKVSGISISQFRQLADTSEGYPTWDSDIINVKDFRGQDVGYTGKGVYVVVLDTGLVANWRDYFPTARILDDLGRGFVEDVHLNNQGQLETNGIVHETTFIGDLGSSHGTHVTSTIIGYFYDSPVDNSPDIPPIAVRGIAPKATIIPVKVLETYHFRGLTGSDGVTFGTDAMVAAGIDYATQLKVAGFSPMVINMSFGSGLPSYVVKRAIDNAIANGVILVAAAGNQGPYGGMGWPAAFPDVISVGASGWTGEWLWPDMSRLSAGNRLWWLQSDLTSYNDIPEDANAAQTYVPFFSSRGITNALAAFPQQLDVLAPGSWVRGPFPIGPGYSHLPWWSQGEAWLHTPIHAGGNNFHYVAGTSMATPHVSAVAALLLEKYPGLTQADVEKTLKDTALPIRGGSALVFNIIYGKFDWVVWEATSYQEEATGAGLIQADRALAVTPLLAGVPPPQQLPSLTEPGHSHLFGQPILIPNPTPDGRPPFPEDFGTSLATYGDNLLVGANQDNTFAPHDGAAYLFDGKTGDLIRIFENPSPSHCDPYSFRCEGDLFGGALASQGDKVLIGAILDDTSAVDAGAVYIFNGTTGQLIRTVADPDPHSYDYFGRSIAVIGNNFVVGAMGKDNLAGAAYLFDGSTGQLLRIFRDPTPAPNELFGTLVRPLGNNVLIRGVSDHGGTYYLFDGASGQLIRTFVDPNSRGLGWAQPCGNNVIAGSTVNIPGWTSAGVVYLFDGSTANLIETFPDPNPSIENGFGVSLSCIGSIVLIGAPRANDGLIYFAGVVYAFDSTTCQLLQIIQDPFSRGSGYFGNPTVAIGNKLAVTTGPGGGPVYLFKPAGETSVSSGTSTNSSTDGFEVSDWPIIEMNPFTGTSYGFANNFPTPSSAPLVIVWVSPDYEEDPSRSNVTIRDSSASPV